MKMTTINVGVQKNVLIAPELAFSIGCQVASTGVSAVNGKKIIPAGTIVGAETSVLTERGTVLTVTKTETIAQAQGVLVNDVDVTAGTATGTLLVSGFADLDKMPETAAELATNAGATGLAKITFVKGDAH